MKEESSELLDFSRVKIETGNAPYAIFEHSIQCHTHRTEEDVECPRLKQQYQYHSTTKADFTNTSFSRKESEDENQTGLFQLQCLTEDFLLRIDRFEIANAVSMIVPAAVSFSLIYLYPSLADRFTWALAWAPVIHFPFSFSYHLYLAVPDFEESWALLCHRLDSGLIHIVSCLYAYGTSKSLVYTLLTVVVNGIPTVLLWRSESRVPNTNMMSISILTYMAPMLWYHSYLTFALVGLAFYITAFVWEKRVFGLCYHSMMHVMMGMPQALVILNGLGLIPSFA